MDKVAEKTFKILLIGAAAVGKTSLVNRYVQGKFRKDYVLTIGMEPYTKYETINGTNICFTIFDIAGEQQFSRLRKMFYRGSRGSLVVFDLTRRSTFEEIGEWIKDAKEVQPDQQFILVGNKADLKGQRDIKKNEGVKLAKELNCLDYIETSAKTGIHVEESFTKLGEYILQE